MASKVLENINGTRQLKKEISTFFNYWHLYNISSLFWHHDLCIMILLLLILSFLLLLFLLSSLRYFRLRECHLVLYLAFILHSMQNGEHTLEKKMGWSGVIGPCEGGTGVVATKWLIEGRSRKKIRWPSLKTSHHRRFWKHMTRYSR